LFRDLRDAAFGLPGQFLNWHPNSREILYKTISGLEPGLWRVDVHSGRHLVVVQPDPPDGISGGAISPDGQIIVYAWYRSIGYPGQIWKVNVDGSEPRLIAEGGAPYVFSFSPNGKYFVYTGGINGDKDTSISGGRFWIMDANGQNRRPLSGPFIFGWGFQPVWSPDGQWLAFTGQDKNQEFGCIRKRPQPDFETCWFEGTAIYIENVLTGELRRLSPGIDPAWSPDGSMIAFASSQGGTPEIWAININGTGLRQLTHQGKLVRYPVWVLR
jgi:TolB protein